MGRHNYEPEGQTLFVDNCMLLRGGIGEICHTRVIPSVLVKLQARLKGGAGYFHPSVSMSLFKVYKYHTGHGYLEGSPPTSQAVNQIVERMMTGFKGDPNALVAEVAKMCPSISAKHTRTIVVAFKCYARAVLDFQVLRFIQVHRGEVYSEADRDAVQQARMEYNEVER